MQVDTAVMHFRVRRFQGFGALCHQIAQVLKTEQQGALTLWRFSSLIGELNFLSGAVVSLHPYLASFTPPSLSASKRVRVGW